MVNKITPLDEEIRREIEASEDSVRVFHGVHFYGLRGLAHIELLNQANEVYLGNSSLEDFIKRYNPIEGKEPGKPGLSLAPLSKTGVFIHPIHLNEHIKSRFTPFEGDLSNGLYHLGIKLRTSREDQKLKDYERDIEILRNELQTRDWTMEDFINPEVIRLGTHFSKVLIDNQITAYEDKVPNSGRYGNTIPLEPLGPPLTKRELELGRRLVAHYREAEEVLTPGII